MHSTSVYDLKLSVLRCTGTKALATDHRENPEQTRNTPGTPPEHPPDGPDPPPPPPPNSLITKMGKKILQNHLKKLSMNQ